MKEPRSHWGQLIRQFLVLFVIVLLALELLLFFLDVPSIYFFKLEDEALRFNSGKSGRYSYSAGSGKSDYLRFSGDGFLSQPASSKTSNKAKRVLFVGGSIAWGWPYHYDYNKVFTETSGGPVDTIQCSTPVASSPYLLELSKSKCSTIKDIDFVVVQLTSSLPVFPHAIFYGEHLSPNWYNALNVSILEAWPIESLIQTTLNRRTVSLNRRQIEALAGMYQPSSPLYHFSNLYRFLENKWMLATIGPQRVKALHSLVSGLKSKEFRKDLVLEQIKKFTTVWPKEKLLFYVVPTKSTALSFSKISLKNEDPRKSKFRISLDELTKDLNHEGIHYIDFLKVFQNQPDIDGLYSSTDFHPNKSGYDLISEHLANKLKSMGMTQ